MTNLLSDIKRHKTLVAALVQRYLAARYRGSTLGFVWSLLNPLCLMLVYSIVFHYYMRIGGVDRYEVFLFCGLLPWIWSSSALVEGTNSIASSGHLITKSMFPAHLLPLVSVISTGINFLLSCVVLLLFLFIFNIYPAPSWFLFPVVVILHYLFLYGSVLALSSLNVLYRDIQHIVTNFLTIIFFLCPIVYPAANIPEKWRFSLFINPFACFTLVYQEIILNGSFPEIRLLFSIICYSILCILAGKIVYERVHEKFAEVL